MLRATLFLGSILVPIGFVMGFVLFAPPGCTRSAGPAGGGWEPLPPPFTPEPPNPRPISIPWDASIPLPESRNRNFDLPNLAVQKPVRIVGSQRFHCPFFMGAIALSPDGKRLACGANLSAVRLFDPTTGEQVGRLHGPDGPINRLAFSPDSKRLYGSSGNLRLCVWDVDDQRGIAQVAATNWGLTADGSTLMTAEPVGVRWVGEGPVPLLRLDRPVIRFRDTRTWQETEAVAATGMGPAVAISPDGRHLALGGEGGTVRVWDRGKREELPALAELSRKPPDAPAHFHPGVTRLLFSPDGKALVGVSNGVSTAKGTRYLAVWNWPTGELAHRLAVGEADLSTLAFSPDSRRLLTIGDRVIGWDVATGKACGESPRGETAFTAAAFTPDGNQLFVSTGRHRVHRVGFPTPTPIEPAPGPTELPFALRQSVPQADQDLRGWLLPDGTTIRQGRVGVSGESFGILHLDAQGKLVRYYLKNCAVGCDVSPDGKRLVTHGHRASPGDDWDLPLQLWDLATGAELVAIPVSLPKSLLAVRFSPDGKQLALLYQGGLVRIWSLAESRPILALDPNGFVVSDVAFSKDGRFLVGLSGVAEAPAVVWEVPSGK